KTPWPEHACCKWGTKPLLAALACDASEVLSAKFEVRSLSMRMILILLIAFQAAVALADDWPQWRGPRRDGVWRETAIVEKFDHAELTPRWRTPIGSGYAGPVVAGGRVYVTDRLRDKGTERVLCLNEATGRVAWAHEYACSYKGVDYD